MNFLIVNQHTMNYGDDIAGISLIQQILSRFSEKGPKVDIIYNTKGQLNFDDKNVTHHLNVTLKNIGYLQLLVFFFFSFFKVELIFNSRLKQFKDIVQNSDIIFVSPCGANIGIYKDWRFLVKLWLVVKFGGTPIFHNNTIGNSDNSLFNIISKYVLKKSVIYVRELASYEFLKKKGINSIRSVDTGFLFENNKSFTFDKNYTVFIPTSIDTWHPNFKDLNVTDLIKSKVLKQYVELIQKEELKLVILPHLYEEMDEKPLLLSYKEKFMELGIQEENIIIPDIEDCFDYDNYIRYSNFVVSMRYHGVIMSIKNKVPFISLAYENKMKEACSYSGVDFLNVNISHLMHENIDFESIWDRKTEIMEALDDSSNSLRLMASQCLNQISFLFKD